MVSLASPPEDLFSEAVQVKRRSLDYMAGAKQPIVIDDTATNDQESEENEESKELETDHFPPSPSTSATHINVSTPFATDSSKFEYPFPDVGKGSDTLSNTILHPSPAFSWPTLPDNNENSSLSYGSANSSPDHITADPSPTKSSFPTFKIKLSLLPMPPALLRRRPRWSFGLLGRRQAAQATSEVQSGVDSDALLSKEENSRGL
ncbi:hypothetical protein CPB83DRAFT_843365 [Crepidotus variabilis]|uniref:Uncharacterized protein n=1 Tax=Crepidotus variabilis TaxID=179855 RepID=A0A9P6EU86_9AGAR|nr:hypothetical protein CPB83DRAFT_843365 [Crepidotus variabilis]